MNRQKRIRMAYKRAKERDFERMTRREKEMYNEIQELKGMVVVMSIALFMLLYFINVCPENFIR